MHLAILWTLFGAGTTGRIGDNEDELKKEQDCEKGGRGEGVDLERKARVRMDQSAASTQNPSPSILTRLYSPSILLTLFPLQCLKLKWYLLLGQTYARMPTVGTA